MSHVDSHNNVLSIEFKIFLLLNYFKVRAWRKSHFAFNKYKCTLCHG